MAILKNGGISGKSFTKVTSLFDLENNHKTRQIATEALVSLP